MNDSYHYFHSSVHPSVPSFQNRAKQNSFQLRIVITTARTLGLAEEIIDDTHVFLFLIIPST